MAAAAVDYGIDAPLVARGWFGRAAWSFGVGLAFWFMNRQEYPGPAGRMLAVLTLIALACAGIAWCKIRSSRDGKLRLREQLLDQLALKGDEKVLDVGCGRGLITIGVAKRLTKMGRVTGVDIWRTEILSGNSLDAAKQNAKLERVSERVTFESCPVHSLHFRDNTYDVVVSSLAIHNLADDREREQALHEMLRVLKTGGRLLIFDTAETGYYAEVLRAAGAKDVTLSPWSFLWCLPSRSVTARK
jgi:SAM-dependent methyltransferase